VKKKIILELLREGKIGEARDQARRALRSNTGDTEIWFLLGVCQLQLGSLSDARNSFLKVTHLDHENEAAKINLGNISISFGHYEEAEHYFHEVLEINPKKLGALIGASYVAYKKNNLEGALAFIERARKLGGGVIEVMNTYAIVQDALGRTADAEITYRAILERSPGFPPAVLNLGKLLLSRGEYLEARSLLEHSPNPSHQPFETNLTLGRIHAELEEFSLAFQYFDKCFRLDKENPELFYSLADLYSKQFDNENSYIAAKKLYEYGEKNLNNYAGIILSSYLRVMDFDRFKTLKDTILRSHKMETSFLNPLQSCIIFDDPEAHRTCAQRVCEKLPIGPEIVRRIGDGRLKIGYVSGDLREHAVGYLMAGVFESHDKSMFEVSLYANNLSEDTPIFNRISSACDSFEIIKNMSDSEAAQRIVSDGIDILVDLSGHTSGSRLGVFSRRSAPIQATYLGYPGTVGLKSIDYLIADKIVITHQTRKFFSEKIVFLPNCYQANDNRRHQEPMRDDDRLNINDDQFVFCSFNSPHKYNPDTIDAWANILTASEGSVIWVLGPSATFQENFLRELGLRGVARERIFFAKNVPNCHHVSRLAQADLFLDSYPYNAHTTASDALWAGVPVLTMAGQAFQSRVAASLLANCGLSSLVTYSWSEYIDLAKKCARDKDFFEGLKTSMKAVRESPLFDTAEFTRGLERGFVRMAELKRSGLPPQDIVA